ncbi:MAG: hypothetical protein KJO22_00500 [Bacteroidia bacterium]|nr:hypothetical protein [Bacteroidia bacterium]
MPRQSERIGRSGEYLVASLLSLYADTVVIVPHSAEADIIFDIDHKLYKCQVKTQSKIRNHRVSWEYDFRRGSFTKKRHYEKEAIDVYAMVALEPQKVMFTFPDGSKQKTIKDEEMQATDSLTNVKNLFKELRCQQTP